MPVILGIDAAWTARQPSGVALVVLKGVTNRRCLAIAPSYPSFIDIAFGKSIEWSSTPQGGECDAPSLLEAAARIACAPVDIVAVDMPLSLELITGRRQADQLVSEEFGARGCSAHSPTRDRPGALGLSLVRGFGRSGFRLATSNTLHDSGRDLVEVYPHPALLGLLGKSRRVPYKTAKSTRYWPRHDTESRKGLLLSIFKEIAAALGKELGAFDLPLPDSPASVTLTQLKRYEDALDALICCWVGLLYTTGNAVPLGDESGAIWCPANVIERQLLDYRDC